MTGAIRTGTGNAPIKTRNLPLSRQNNHLRGNSRWLQNAHETAPNQTRQRNTQNNKHSVTKRNTQLTFRDNARRQWQQITCKACKSCKLKAMKLRERRRVRDKDSPRQEIWLLRCLRKPGEGLRADPPEDWINPRPAGKHVNCRQWCRSL